MDVSPAAELPRTAKIHGAKVMEFKRFSSRISDDVTGIIIIIIITHYYIIITFFFTFFYY